MLPFQLLIAASGGWLQREQADVIAFLRSASAKRELVGHDVKTAPEMGWASKKNGELLALAAVETSIIEGREGRIQSAERAKPTRTSIINKASYFLA